MRNILHKQERFWTSDLFLGIDPFSVTEDTQTANEVGTAQPSLSWQITVMVTLSTLLNRPPGTEMLMIKVLLLLYLWEGMWKAWRYSIDFGKRDMVGNRIIWNKCVLTTLLWDMKFLQIWDPEKLIDWWWKQSVTDLVFVVSSCIMFSYLLTGQRLTACLF